MRETRFLSGLVVLMVLLAVLAAACGIYFWKHPEPPPVEEPNATVLRRLELRLDAPLDRTHPVAGGERYRRFECREVPR